MTIEKIEKTVEVHQLQFSYLVVDAQLSRNDELRGFHPDPVHRQMRCCPVVRVPTVQLCKKTVEFPMVQKIQGFGRVTRPTVVSRQTGDVSMAREVTGVKATLTQK